MAHPVFTIDSGLIPSTQFVCHSFSEFAATSQFFKDLGVGERGLLNKIKISEISRPKLLFDGNVGSSPTPAAPLRTL